MPALAERGFHVVSPDYPGSEIIEGWLVELGFTHFGLYHQDHGGPIGNRIVGRHPEWLEWQTVQNSNAYEEGFTAAWDGIRFQLWKERTREDRGCAAPLPRDRGHQVDLPHGPRRLGVDRPKTIIFWDQGNVSFTPERGEAYLRDLPDAEIHRLNAGHFAAEDHVAKITDGMPGSMRRGSRALTVAPAQACDVPSTVGLQDKRCVSERALTRHNSRWPRVPVGEWRRQCGLQPVPGPDASRSGVDEPRRPDLRQPIDRRADCDRPGGCRCRAFAVGLGVRTGSDCPRSTRVRGHHTGGRGRRR